MDKIKLALSEREDGAPAEVQMHMSSEPGSFLLEIAAWGGWETPEEFGTFLCQLGSDLGGSAPESGPVSVPNGTDEMLDTKRAEAAHVPFNPQPKGRA